MQYPGGTAPGYHFYSMQQSTALRTKAFILAKAPCGAVSFCFPPEARPWLLQPWPSAFYRFRVVFYPFEVVDVQHIHI